MDTRLSDDRTTGSGAFATDGETARLTAVRPSPRQLRHAERPFYLFTHFGMNTATGREWGTGRETPADFTVPDIDPDGWAEAALACGAGGVIVTAKHHDGFCMWDTAVTDHSVMRSALGRDVVREVADACRRRDLRFGVYLSPWDMHAPCYGTPAYDDYFCAQLTELLTGYGELFEVWFDGARGEDAVDFSYDWDRYYALVRRYQPEACIAVCGPDVRWIGNEGGRVRQSEWSVVPAHLTRAETAEAKSQRRVDEAAALRKRSQDDDLGSREALRGEKELAWYPAEADVSIRDGWFWPGGGNVKSADALFRLYLNTVGRNASLLLNVPPDVRGRIDDEDLASLVGLGERIRALTASPICEESPGALTDGTVALSFGVIRRPRWCVLAEDVAQSQRIERFDLYLTRPDGTAERAADGTVVGARRIVPLSGEAVGATLVVRQSRGEPILAHVGFYA